MTQENRLSKAQFDALYEASDFEDGPHVSTYAGGYGEPYNPNREAWGTLKDGRKVWAYVRGEKDKLENQPREISSQDPGPWMETASGKKFYFLKPSMSDITVEDIASHLAHESRFGGATNRPYSVLEHSIHVWSLGKDHQRSTQLHLLLHDAHEAYVKDVVRPMKLAINQLAGFDLMKKLVEPIDAAISLALGVDFNAHKEFVTLCDNKLLDVEARVLLDSELAGWAPLALLEYQSGTGAGSAYTRIHPDDFLGQTEEFRAAVSYGRYESYCYQRFISIYYSLVS